MVLILSWNVAGLSTTVNRIHENYKAPSVPSSVMERSFQGDIDNNKNNDYDHDDDDNETNQQQAATTDHNKKRKREDNQHQTNTSSSSNSTIKPLTTTKIIKQFPSSSICYYFSKLHGADIICLQEHKVAKKSLCNRSEPHHCSTLRMIDPDNGSVVVEYESFWSCCTEEKYRGFNGVVTYARKGMVLRANGTNVFGVPELDQQGRCVMTDHGLFVVFNVYVPASCGQPLQYKMKFLNTLRRVMHQQRTEHNKHVILVGDLNIAHTVHDIYWEDRVIYINDILKEVQEYQQRQTSPQPDTSNNSSIVETETKLTTTTTTTSIPQWKFDVAEHWGTIERILQTKEVISTQTTNSRTNEKFEKFRLAVIIPSESNNNNNNNNNNSQSTTSSSSIIPPESKRIYLGKHEHDAKYCLHNYTFESYTYYDEDQGEYIEAGQANVVPVGILIELMSKLVNVQWSETIQRSISGTVDHISPTRKWLSSIIHDDKMIDTFRYYYPNAQSRFTCWSQYTNQRYSNIGARIDYTLIDQALLPFLQKGQQPQPPSETIGAENLESKSLLRCGCDKHTDIENEVSSLSPVLSPYSENAALCAATANGQYKPAAFEGGGIMEAPQYVLDTQFGIPHTGLIYTPPTFSDHIGISVLLSKDILPPNPLVLDSNDIPTRKAQPHKVQTSIASFFQQQPQSNKKNKDEAGSSNASSSNSNMAVTSSTTTQRTLSVVGKEKVDKKKKIIPKGSILNHFRKH